MKIAANDADRRAVATDALLTGYSLRVAKRDLPSALAFDERTTAQLHDLAAKELEIAIPGFALQMAEGRPAAFGEGEVAWAELSAWAGQRASDRDQARRKAEMESRDRPTITATDRERAFALGYGVRYDEEALDPSVRETPGVAAGVFDLGVASGTEVRDAAVRLLIRTEQVFVGLGAPASDALNGRTA